MVSKKPFVLLTSKEWGNLCYPEIVEEIGEEFYVNVDTDITVKFELGKAGLSDQKNTKIKNF